MDNQLTSSLVNWFTGYSKPLYGSNFVLLIVEISRTSALNC